jgi:hypothetical protein
LESGTLERVIESSESHCDSVDPITKLKVIRKQARILRESRGDNRNLMGSLKRIVDDLYRLFPIDIALGKDTVSGLVCPKSIHLGSLSLTLILQ